MGAVGREAARRCARDGGNCQSVTAAGAKAGRLGCYRLGGTQEAAPTVAGRLAWVHGRGRRRRQRHDRLRVHAVPVADRVGRQVRHQQRVDLKPVPHLARPRGRAAVAVDEVGLEGAAGRGRDSRPQRREKLGVQDHAGRVVAHVEDGDRRRGHHPVGRRPRRAPLRAAPLYARRHERLAKPHAIARVE
eukprot:365684-Chlamydomonas_euryale.AAC.16